MIRNFKNIGFNVSIDAPVQKRFEYLRHGADWNEVCKNLDYFHNLVEKKRKRFKYWNNNYYYNF